MSNGDPMRYTVWGSVTALTSALMLLAGSRMLALRAVEWCLLGWLVAAVLGVVCGARLERVHGTGGPAFLKILGACMLARSIAFGAGAVWAVSRGQREFWTFLAGLASGFVPTQVFEAIWFVRKTQAK